MTKSIPCNHIKLQIIECLLKNKEIFGDSFPEFGCSNIINLYSLYCK